VFNVAVQGDETMYSYNVYNFIPTVDYVNVAIQFYTSFTFHCVILVVKTLHLGTHSVYIGVTKSLLDNPLSNLAHYVHPCIYTLMV